MSLVFGHKEPIEAGRRAYLVCEVAREKYVLFRPPIRYHYRFIRDSLLAFLFKTPLAEN